MRGIDKTYVYARLGEIRKQGVDVREATTRVASSDTIPYDIIVFINRYIDIPQLAVYNYIYRNRRKNPLYKNLVNENLPDEEKAVALSSVLTRSLIRAKMIDKEDVPELLELMNVSGICDALCEYSTDGGVCKLRDVFFGIREIMKEIFGNENNEKSEKYTSSVS